jgi:hypothetical protein
MPASPNMGLTNWKGEQPRKVNVTVGKNYLSEEELGLLNLIVDQYLSFAEFQAARESRCTCRTPSQFGLYRKRDFTVRAFREGKRFQLVSLQGTPRKRYRA